MWRPRDPLAYGALGTWGRWWDPDKGMGPGAGTGKTGLARSLRRCEEDPAQPAPGGGGRWGGPTMLVQMGQVWIHGCGKKGIKRDQRQAGISNPGNVCKTL